MNLIIFNHFHINFICYFLCIFANFLSIYYFEVKVMNIVKLVKFEAFSLLDCLFVIFIIVVMLKILNKKKDVRKKLKEE